MIVANCDRALDRLAAETHARYGAVRLLVLLSPT